jgi:histidyl-tRNA synthetase
LNVDLSLQPTRGVGEQLKRADRKGIPLAVIVGAAELAEGRASLKELRSGEQTTHPIEELAVAVRERLARLRIVDAVTEVP